MQRNQLYKIVLMLGFGLLATGLFFMINSRTTPASFFLIGGLCLLAISLQGFAMVRGFSYTFWILTAVNFSLF
jgi:hypothetical protein